MNPVRYQAIFEPQKEGGFTVTFPDMPEAIIEGKNRKEALFNAVHYEASEKIKRTFMASIHPILDV